jgi:hypothetical protein
VSVTTGVTTATEKTGPSRTAVDSVPLPTCTHGRRRMQAYPSGATENRGVGSSILPLATSTENGRPKGVRLSL